MSKREIAGQPVVTRTPADQVNFFADLYREAVNPQAYARLKARVRDFGLEFPDDELLVLAALDTPARVQEFLNTQIYYNNDHAFPGQEETALAPRGVLRTGVAHCFEGAMFAYAVNFLHGHAPVFALLEASQDSDHNLAILQDPHTGLYGSNAHSLVDRLDGRPLEYPTLRALAESYQPYYYSDRTWDPKHLTLVAYSDTFDLAARFGVAWMASDEPLWDIYFTFMDDTINFHYLFDDSGETHIYPMLHAVKQNWIRIGAPDNPFVSVVDLPRGAADLWDAFWRAFDRKEIVPRGAAHEIQEQFRQLTRTTPLDLEENAHELRKFLALGYRIEQVIQQAN